MDYVAVLLFGGLVGLAELVARYRDEPSEAFKTVPGIAYILINALVAAGMLLLSHVFHWTFGLGSSADATQICFLQVLIAGFAAMALLRSSFFTVRMGNQDIGIGASAVVQSLLRAMDSSVDRKRGASRNESVAFMDGISFDKAIVILPTYCLQLMQNLPTLEQEALARNVDSLRKLRADNCVKSRMLGLAIMNVMGLKVLKSAVVSLGDEITLSPAPVRPPVAAEANAPVLPNP